MYGRWKRRRVDSSASGFVADGSCCWRRDPGAVGSFPAIQYVLSSSRRRGSTESPSRVKEYKV
jgi:hypothetical protein